MDTGRDLSALAVGERIQDPLLVLAVEQRGGDTPHAILTLSNQSGRIQTAPFWSSDQPRLAGIGRGTVVQVIGEVSSYKDRRQLKVTSIRALPEDEVSWRALMPSAGEAGRFWETLDRWRGAITRPRLTTILALFYEDEEFRRRYQECPASPRGHHDVLGGLLQHTTEVGAIARAIGRACHADPDLILAGVLLHDIGKLDAYSWNGFFDTTEAGHLLGHVVLGSLMLERRVREVSPLPCTEQELRILQHLVLSHHGRQEFGAPVPPMTLEAEVLHYADNASAKTASMADALADRENFNARELVSARKIWQIDRRGYRGRSDWGALPPTNPEGGE